MSIPALRRDPRITQTIPVLVMKGRVEVPSSTGDVSYRGLFLRTEQPPALNALVKLRLRLPTREIEAHAMTVRIATGPNPGIGLQFWGLSGAERAAWDAFVRELLQQSGAVDKGRGPHSRSS